jgi:tRNA(Ile)-lysidine synthetase-like protein
VGSVGFVVEMADIQSIKQPVGTTVANLGFPFTIRHWKEGDWMRPLGMKGRRKKLSDMFGDLKFSALEKERALVIAGEGSHVLALVGYRIDESIALSNLDLKGKASEHKLTITLCPSVLPVE